MSHVTKQSEKHSVADWTELRPRVTKSLLAGIVQRIVEKFPAEKIVLFGSYAKGAPDRDSDVDLLVVMESKEPMSQRIRRVTEPRDNISRAAPPSWQLRNAFGSHEQAEAPPQAPLTKPLTKPEEPDPRASRRSWSTSGSRPE